MAEDGAGTAYLGSQSRVGVQGREFFPQTKPP